MQVKPSFQQPAFQTLTRNKQLSYARDIPYDIYYDGKSWRVVGAGDKQVTGFDVRRRGKNWKSVKDNE